MLQVLANTRVAVLFPQILRISRKMTINTGASRSLICCGGGEGFHTTKLVFFSPALTVSGKGDTIGKCSPMGRVFGGRETMVEEKRVVIDHLITTQLRYHTLP